MNSMIGMKLGWLLLVLANLAAFALSGQTSALVIGLMLVLIPLGTLPVNLYLRKRLNVEIDSPLSQRKNHDGEIRVSVENPTWLPVFRVRLYVTVENQLNREKHTLPMMTWASPRGTQSVAVQISSPFCGRLRISADRLVLSDCFDLFWVSAKAGVEAHLTVQPETFEPQVRMLPRFGSSEDSDLYAPDRPGYDLSEPYQIRDYILGDSPRQIHWKLSGKFDRFIVRDPALPISTDVLVFWERTGETGDPAIIDAQAEIVISLCRSLLDSGIRFTLGWNDTDRNLCVLHPLREMDDLVAIIPRLLRATGTEIGVSGAGLLLQTRPDALCAHMIYLAQTPQSEMLELQRFGHVTPISTTTGLIFDCSDYGNQLAEIEI